MEHVSSLLRGAGPTPAAALHYNMNLTWLPLSLSLSHPQNRELQIMKKLDHCNIVRLRYFFYSSGDKVSRSRLQVGVHLDSDQPPLLPTVCGTPWHSMYTLIVCRT